MLSWINLAGEKDGGFAERPDPSMTQMCADDFEKSDILIASVKISAADWMLDAKLISFHQRLGRIAQMDFQNKTKQKQTEAAAVFWR